MLITALISECSVCFSCSPFDSIFHDLFQMDLKDRVQSFVGHLLDIEEWKEWYMNVETIILHPFYDEEGISNYFIFQL